MGLATGALLAPLLAVPAGAETISTPRPDNRLTAVGPADPTNGFPYWYGDTENRLELCLEAAECPLLLDEPLPNPDAPMSFPDNFPAEAFWWAGEASIDRPVGTSARLVLAQEAAFGGEDPAVGDQNAFARLRIRIDGLAVGQTYTVTHPYGVEQFVAEDDGKGGGEINYTEDIGCFDAPCGADFDRALTGRVGPFLRWDADAPAGHLGDANVPHTVTGSPYGTNIFRIEGPNAGGPGVNSVETDLFSIQGKIAELKAGVDLPGGLYATPQQVKIQASFPEARIIYTTDGTEPTVDTNGTRTNGTEWTPNPAAPADGPVVTVGQAAPANPGGGNPNPANPNPGTPANPNPANPGGPAMPADPNQGSPAIPNPGGPANPNPGGPADPDGPGEPAPADQPVETVLKYIAVDTNGVPTPVYTEAYTVNGNLPFVESAPAAGGHPGHQEVTLTGTDPADLDATVYYTLDGTRPGVVDGEPQGSTLVYTKPLTITRSTTIKAMAVNSEGTAGAVSTFRHTINNLKLKGDVGVHGFPVSLTDNLDQTVYLDVPSNAWQANWPEEGFWWSAEAEMPLNGGTGSARLTHALEAAFANETVNDGDQVAFHRTRYRMDGLVPGATYKITHPYGEGTARAEADGTVNFTNDFGCLSGGCDAADYERLLEGEIGPFLTRTGFVPGDEFLGDGATATTVTGSPTGNNFFQVVQLTDGTGAVITPVEVGRTDQFVVTGRTTPAPAADFPPAPANPAPVNPAPANPAPFATPFTDVAADTQFAAEIARLADLGITTGFPDGTFQPTQPVNRDAIAAFLFRLAGEPGTVAAAAAFTDATPNDPFADVTPSNQFYREISWLKSTGVTTGFEDGTFRYLQPVNRDAMAAFLYRMAGEPEFTAPEVSPFDDVTTDNQFYKEITWLESTGITTGFTDGSFRPYESVNRDAMAAFLIRYIDAGLGTPGTPA